MKNVTISLYFILCLTGIGFSQSWLLHMQRPDLEMTDIGFINPSQGYIIADSSSNGTLVTGAFIKTTDGGQTWTNHTFGNSAYTINKAFFINSQEGFAAGRNGGGNNGLFIKTTDGGYTWTGATAFNERAYNVCFINAQQGWIMGKNGLLSRTTDGGVSWTVQTITNEDIFAMQFFNSTKGIFICSGGELYQTTDGGATWNLTAAGASDDLLALAIRGSRAWVTGQNGTMLYSDDDGDTWVSQTPSSNDDLMSVSFADQNHGWAGGAGGVLDFTIDGGNSWLADNSNTTEDIVAISVPDNNHGWFCNVAGDVFSFTIASGINSIQTNQNSVTVYPNPVKDLLSLSFQAKQLGDYSITLHDIQNRSVKMVKVVVNHIGIQNISIEISTLAEGTYLGEVSGSTQLEAFKCIIIK